MKKILKSSEKDDILAVSSVMVFVGWTLIISLFIFGIVNGNDHHDKFELADAIWYWVTGVVSGIVLIGFGRIIQLLEKIAYKDYEIVEVDDTKSKEYEE